MLLVKANLIAGSGHSKFQAGESVAAVLFVASDSIEAAEDLLAPVLLAQGWAKIATERYKDVASADSISEPLLLTAFHEAAATGVGYVLFPAQVA